MEFKKRSTHRTQKKQEKRVASRLGGKRQPFSGSKIWAKGDAVVDELPDELMIDAKQTQNKSISIKIDQLKKIVDEANGEGRVGSLSIEFLNMDRLYEQDWMVVPLWWLKELVDEYRTLKRRANESESSSSISEDEDTEA